MTDPNTVVTLRTLLLLGLLATTGCSAITGKADPTTYHPVGPGVELSASESADDYLAVRQARAQNSVVLQVVGDEEPNRILPLPSGGKSVFVSDLLKQTGVLNKLGNVNVVLYRSSPHSIDGLQMGVKMTSGGDQVRPESDYALQPGDRIRVNKVQLDTVRQLVEMTLGRSLP